jgi:hypothetical protein
MKNDSIEEGHEDEEDSIEVTSITALFFALEAQELGVSLSSVIDFYHDKEKKERKRKKSDDSTQKVNINGLNLCNVCINDFFFILFLFPSSTN